MTDYEADYNLKILKRRVELLRLLKSETLNLTEYELLFPMVLFAAFELAEVSKEELARRSGTDISIIEYYARGIIIPPANFGDTTYLLRAPWIQENLVPLLEELVKEGLEND